MLFTDCNQVAHVLLRSLPVLESPTLRVLGQHSGALVRLVCSSLEAPWRKPWFESLSVLELLDGWPVVVEVK